MQKKVKPLLAALLAVFVAIQFFPIEMNVSVAVPITDFTKVNNVPTAIANRLRTSCYDCHSNDTKYPWYGQIQPVAWYMERHIRSGKKALNFSDWGNLSKRRKHSKLSAIIEQMEEGKMPLAGYRYIHGKASLNEESKAMTIDFMRHLINEQDSKKLNQFVYDSLALYIE
ncbi:MAG: heme-binding domain-containing protein [Flavobacteriaceae bacterium]